MAGCAAGATVAEGRLRSQQSGAPGGVVSPGVQTHQISVSPGSLPTSRRSIRHRPGHTCRPEDTVEKKPTCAGYGVASPRRCVLLQRPANRRFPSGASVRSPWIGMQSVAEYPSFNMPFSSTRAE